MSDARQSDQQKRKGLFSRLKQRLNKSSSTIKDGITDIFTKRKLDDVTLDELEELLIRADLGVVTAAKVCARIGEGRYDKDMSPDEIRRILAREIERLLAPVEVPLTLDPEHRPHIILVVGVNGTGKTTTIGKLAKQFSDEGRRVVLAAADTFRAAAVEQLRIWGERINAPVVEKQVGADAAGVVFEAVEKAQKDDADVLMIDTAGRLQNKAHLMAELEKVIRVIKKRDETAPHSVLLVLDATTGQNTISQVEVFKEATGVTGLVMTKLDGTARGGILVALAEKFELPVNAIGVGENVEDLQPFNVHAFAQALTGDELGGS